MEDLVVWVFTAVLGGERSSSSSVTSWYLIPSTSKYWLTFYFYLHYIPCLFLNQKQICQIHVLLSQVCFFHTSVGFLALINCQLKYFLFLFICSNFTYGAIAQISCDQLLTQSFLWLSIWILVRQSGHIRSWHVYLLNRKTIFLNDMFIA